MGLDALRNLAKGQSPDGPTRQIMDLVPGNRLENWEEIHNLRLEYDGPYIRLKRRGGTTSQYTYGADILTMYPFSARPGNVLTNYIAVHLTNGSVNLYNVDADTSIQILTGFSTTDKIQIAHSGIFLYCFEYDYGVAKYYDLEAAAAYDYLDYDRSYITTINRTYVGFENTPDILGFEAGKQIIVFPNFHDETDAVAIINSSSGAGQLDPSLYDVNSFRYNYNGGKYLIDGDGNELKTSQVLGFVENGSPLQYTIGGTGSEFTIDTLYYPLDVSGNLSFESYIAEILSITDTGADTTTVKWKDPVGIEQTVSLNGETDSTNVFYILPYSPDLDSLVGLPSNKAITSDGITVEANSNYEERKIYRQYVVLDQLNDGSITIPGLPYQVDFDAENILVDGAGNIDVTVTAAGANVARRFLCSTRWQATADSAFNPSSPSYPNSPLFIVREIDVNLTIISDSTEDLKLLRPISEQISNLAGGIADQFNTGELVPDSVAPFGGSLLIGGYKVNRSVPVPYTNPATALQENIYVNITSTTQLANNMALAFQFEYVDGKRSDIVETEEFLQEGNSVTTAPATCDQVKAFCENVVTNGAVRDGILRVTYEGQSIDIPVTSAGTGTPATVAEAIRAAIQAEPNYKISAAVNVTPTIIYEDVRFGVDNNGKTVTISQPTPYTLDGASYVQAFTGITTAVPNAITFTPDGLYAVLACGTDLNLRAFTLSTAFDVSTMVASTVMDVSAEETQDVVGVCFGDSGNKLYIAGADDEVNEYDLSTAYDISTATFNQALSVSTETTNPYYVHFNDDGTKMYIGRTTVYEYNLGTAWDISTAVYTGGDNFTLPTSEWDLVFHPSGTRFWTAEVATDEIRQYDLGTAWDITSAVYDQAFDVSTENTNMRGVYVSPDGLHLITTGQTAPSSIFEYDLPSDLGITFNTAGPIMAGATVVSGSPAEATLVPIANNLSGGTSENYNVEIDANLTADFTISSSDSLGDIAVILRNAINADPTISADWTAALGASYVYDGSSYQSVVITRNIDGTAANGTEVRVNPTGTLSVEIIHTAPGETERLFVTYAQGGGDGCLQGSGSYDVGPNSLAGAATEDHTLTIDGDSTVAITIIDTDTPEQIVDKYIAAIEADYSLDILWEATKSDNGDGTFKLTLTYREYGTAGNAKVLSISGDVDVTVAANTPTAGGDDGGDIPTGSATELSANLLQIHSLNLLIAKVFVLGRTTGAGTVFHLIQEVNIGDAEAHGMVIELPNTTAELDVIEASTHAQPAATDIREVITFPNYVSIGTPFQEFSISGQKQLKRQSEVLRLIPLSYDVDKGSMRYKFLVVTDENLQMVYLVDTGAGFDIDAEIFYEGLKIKDNTRAGITLVENDRVIMHTEDGIKLYDQGRVTKLIDDREYDLVKTGTLTAAVLNRVHNEYWFHFDNIGVLVWDLTNEAVRSFSFDGASIPGNPTEAIYGHGNLVVGLGNELSYTDLENVHDDLGQGAGIGLYINAYMISKHLGGPNNQTKILEITVAGETYLVQAQLDLQRERLEGTGGAFGGTFTADVTTTPAAATIAGKSFQFHYRAVMPKIKIDITGDGAGFIAFVNMAYQQYENRGKARI